MHDDGLPIGGVGAAQDHDLRRRDFGVLRGLGCSVLLHAPLLLLLIVGFARPDYFPPNPASVLLVNLTQLADTTGSPSADRRAPIPQQPATETATRPSPAAIPEPASPPRHPAVRQPAKGAAPSPQGTRAVDLADSSSPSPQANDRETGREQRPATDLDVQLERLAQLRQPAPLQPPQPRTQDGTGLSSAAAANGTPGATSFSVKDFIRAQVERRWNPDVKVAGDWTVSVHVTLDRNGNVVSAEIVDDPQFRLVARYHDLALSARNAVLLSSPLTIPPGAFDVARDIVLDFNPRRVLQ